MGTHLLILHDARESTNEGREQLKTRLQSRLGIAAETLDLMFSQLPVIIKKDLSAAEAKSFQDAFEQLGAVIEIRSANGNAKNATANIQTNNTQPEKPKAPVKDKRHLTAPASDDLTLQFDDDEKPASDEPASFETPVANQSAQVSKADESSPFSFEDNAVDAEASTIDISDNVDRSEPASDKPSLGDADASGLSLSDADLNEALEEQALEVTAKKPVSQAAKTGVEISGESEPIDDLTPKIEPLSPEEEKRVLENAFAHEPGAADRPRKQNRDTMAPYVTGGSPYGNAEKRARVVVFGLMLLLVVAVIGGGVFLTTGGEQRKTQVVSRLDKKQVDTLMQDQRSIINPAKETAEKAAALAVKPSIEKTWRAVVNQGTVQSVIVIQTKDGLVTNISFKAKQDASPERTPEEIVNNVQRVAWLRRADTEGVAITIENSAANSAEATNTKETDLNPKPKGPEVPNQVSGENSFNAVASTYAYLRDGAGTGRVAAQLTIQGLLTAEGETVEGAWRLKNGEEVAENTARRSGSAFLLNYGGTFSATSETTSESETTDETSNTDTTDENVEAGPNPGELPTTTE